MAEIKSIRHNSKTIEETKSAISLKFKPEFKPFEHEKISAIMKANKEKMKNNLGNLLLNSKEKANNRIKIRQNLLKKAESFHKNTDSIINSEICNNNN